MESIGVTFERDTITKTRLTTFELDVPGKLYKFRWSPDLEEDLFDRHRLEPIQLLLEFITEKTKQMTTIIDLGESELKYPNYPEIAYRIWKNYTLRQALFVFGFSINDKLIWTRALPPRPLTDR